MSTQPRLHSLLEQILNVGSGFIISYFLWIFYITYKYDIEVSRSDNLEIVLTFTVVSVIRGLMWRRGFNWYQHHRIVK